ncbi:hypothetical protein [Brachyspira sp.]|uniref:hypothetical protein n=1 Tax=Brachyspira sp. TaxID=1977261 RepID=UPI002624B44B|nr:hypothetical protein [Brachyspira sp.]
MFNFHNEVIGYDELIKNVSALIKVIYFDNFKFNPKIEDIKIFNNILKTIDLYNIKNDSANKMQKVLKNIFPSSKYERIIFLEILAYLNILESKDKENTEILNYQKKLMHWRREIPIINIMLIKYFLSICNLIYIYNKGIIKHTIKENNKYT